jgi:hypothetical protein
VRQVGMELSTASVWANNQVLCFEFERGVQTDLMTSRMCVDDELITLYSVIQLFPDLTTISY